jgi:hypothetical protein
MENTSTLETPSHSYSSNGPFNLCVTVNDGVGCSDFYCDTVGINGAVFKSNEFTINIISSGNGISNISEHNLASIKIYPNPAFDFISLNVFNEEFISVKILDCKGKVCEDLNIQNNLIDVSNLSNGIYFIYVITKTGYMSNKFIKE